jgi:HEAT repeat protein
MSEWVGHRALGLLALFTSLGLACAGCQAVDGLPSGASLRTDAHAIRHGTREQALSAAADTSEDLRHVTVSSGPMADAGAGSRQSAMKEDLVPAILERLALSANASDHDMEYALGQTLYWAVMLLDVEAARYAAPLGATLRPSRATGQGEGWHHEAVLRALACLGPKALPAQADVETALHSADDHVALEAGRTLAAMGPGAADSLIRNLRDGRPVARQAATAGLGDLRPFDADWLPLLADALRDESNDVARSATQALLGLSYDGMDLRSIREAVASLAHHSSPIVRSDAAGLLARIPEGTRASRD